jgi:hypothetical protein
MAFNYYPTTRPTALSAAMNSSTTTCPVVDSSSYPDPAIPGNGQYTIIIGYGSDREEVCTVTAKTGLNLTVIRGQDSSAASAKNAGDVVVHGVSARDFLAPAQAVAGIPTAVAAAVNGSIVVSTGTPVGAPSPTQSLWIQV